MVRALNPMSVYWGLTATEAASYQGHSNEPIIPPHIPCEFKATVEEHNSDRAFDPCDRDQLGTSILITTKWSSQAGHTTKTSIGDTSVHLAKQNWKEDILCRSSLECRNSLMNEIKL